MANDYESAYLTDEENYDARPSDVAATIELKSNPNSRVAVIRTSDRISFKRCRRQWGWGSHLRGNLGGRQAVSPLWLGSGMHFALEDFHGLNLYGNPEGSLEAYAIATHKRFGPEGLPPTWRSDLELGCGMMLYYSDKWLTHRDPLNTFIYNGRPQLEVNFRIAIPFDASHWGFEDVVYSGTIDRVTIDDDGILWVNEYKSAKMLAVRHFQTDPQVTAYCWAASLMYPGYTIGGVIYQQHLKTLPHEATILKSGHVSTNKAQLTDYQSYRRALVGVYGNLESISQEQLDTLNAFSALEEPTRNKFIRRDYIERSQHQCEAEGQKILLEVAEMLNPDLPLYPNATRDCSWCSVQGPCVSMDAGEAFEIELEAFTRPRELMYDSWRAFLPPADRFLDIARGYNWSAEAVPLHRAYDTIE